MIIQGIEIYYAAACLILVCSSVFCAFVRYFHMCRPFDENESYFYPARKLITFILRVLLCLSSGYFAWIVRMPGYLCGVSSFSFCPERLFFLSGVISLLS